HPPDPPAAAADPGRGAAQPATRPRDRGPRGRPAAGPDRRLPYRRRLLAERAPAHAELRPRVAHGVTENPEDPRMALTREQRVGLFFLGGAALLVGFIEATVGSG